MATTESARWGFALLAAVAGLGLAAVGIYELWANRPVAGRAGGAQPAGVTVRAQGLTVSSK